jgi:hypothetical protein
VIEHRMVQRIFDLPVLQCKNNNVLYVVSDICNSTIQKRIHIISMATLLIFVSHFPEKCAPYFQGRKKYVYFGEVMGCKGC